MSLITILTFVKKQHENEDVYTFLFASKQPIRHKAGQHGLFILPGLYRPHPFTISSAPSEKCIAISTHTKTGSRFKDRLMSLVEGDKIVFVGPLLNFTFVKNETNHVFLAQGIGITPFRSMLTEGNTDNPSAQTTLIHVDSKGHSFKELTSKHATHAYYPTSQNEFQELVTKQNPNQTFYLSGSPRFVRETKTLLKTMGVTANKIKVDSFLGY